ncbi:MAG: alpha-amylase family glycosyl hydrolase [Bacteroidota bacterium]
MTPRLPLTAILFAGLLLLSSSAQAQDFTDEDLRQGYADRGATTVFVFDAEAYGVVPERVVVTGAFRNWSEDMNAMAWRLTPDDERRIWVLAVENPDFQTIPPSAPFKFRIDGGVWLDPRPDAPNQGGGNLIYAMGITPPLLTAEVRAERAIWASLSGDNIERPRDVSAYRLVTAAGEEVPLEAVLANTASAMLVVPAAPIDVRRVYYLEVPELELRTLVRRDGWFRTRYSAKPLGADVAADGSRTDFRIFSPRADAVRLYLYDEPEATSEDAQHVIDMAMDADGVWEAARDGDLHGTYYDFTVHGPADPGNFFYETHPVHISDPYARVNAEAHGKSRVWRTTAPATPLPGGRPPMEDVIAYEVHVQDFTDLLPVSDDLVGTIPAMAMPGLTNSAGAPIGFDYLVDLSINVVHLMPVQEYLHYPDSEWAAAFENDPYMIAQDVHRENYQWGYRTTHAFAIETRLRQRGTEHGAQRDQFRDLVQAFHDEGIAVIIDLVPNHTGENMDARHMLFNFNVLDKPLYYRTDQELNHIGPFGNEVKTEDRPMVQRWLIDQCQALIDEFGIDGFRIDLAGQIDRESLLALKAALPDDIIIYGEPWIPPTDPAVASHPDWGWYKSNSPITFFQDDARNTFKGPVSDPQDKATDRGYAGGNSALREATMRALTNAYGDEATPNTGINYLDIHDNWTLADQFATRDWNGLLGVDEGPYKIAATLLMTSIGPIVLHGGSEIMRSKGSATVDHNIIKETETGPIYLKGRGDTYNLRKANRFVWETVGQTTDVSDFAGMHAYWRGLIHLRNSEYGEVFRQGEHVPEGYYRFITPDNPAALGYVVDETAFVLINTDNAPFTFADVNLPAGDWQQVADADQVNLDGVGGPRATPSGGALTVTVPPTSAMIWVNRDKP